MAYAIRQRPQNMHPHSVRTRFTCPDVQCAYNNESDAHIRFTQLRHYYMYT